MRRRVKLRGPEPQAGRLTTYRISPRVMLRAGDLVRVSRGPEHRGVRFGERGVFEFRWATRVGGRVFVEAARIEQGRPAGRYLLFVAGSEFTHPDLPGVIFRPYRLRRIRRPAKHVRTASVR